MRISDWSSDVCSSDLFEQGRPPAKDRGIGAVDDLLGRRRKEGPERDIIGPRFAGLHGEVAAIVAGDADLGRGAEQRPRLARIDVVFAEVDAVGAEPLREAHIIVDDESSEAHTSALQSLMRHLYAVLCLITKKHY